ncbi:hypothetical protein BB560_004641, partial [Smittium megazygosporum]
MPETVESYSETTKRLFGSDDDLESTESYSTTGDLHDIITNYSNSGRNSLTQDFSSPLSSPNFPFEQTPDITSPPQPSTTKNSPIINSSESTGLCIDTSPKKLSDPKPTITKGSDSDTEPSLHVKRIKRNLSANPVVDSKQDLALSPRLRLNGESLLLEELNPPSYLNNKKTGNPSKQKGLPTSQSCENSPFLDSSTSKSKSPDLFLNSNIQKHPLKTKDLFIKHNSESLPETPLVNNVALPAYTDDSCDSSYDHSKLFRNSVHNLPFDNSISSRRRPKIPPFLPQQNKGSTTPIDSGEEIELNRINALYALSLLEIEFAKFREMIYFQKMAQLCFEEELLKKEIHPVYLEKMDMLNKTKNHAMNTITIEYNTYKQLSSSTFKSSVSSAISTFNSQEEAVKSNARDQLTSQLNIKKRNFESFLLNSSFGASDTGPHSPFFGTASQKNTLGKLLSERLYPPQDKNVKLSSRLKKPAKSKQKEKQAPNLLPNSKSIYDVFDLSRNGFSYLSGATPEEALEDSYLIGISELQQKKSNPIQTKTTRAYNKKSSLSSSSTTKSHKVPPTNGNPASLLKDTVSGTHPRNKKPRVKKDKEKVKGNTALQIDPNTTLVALSSDKNKENISLKPIDPMSATIKPNPNFSADAQNPANNIRPTNPNPGFQILKSPTETSKRTPKPNPKDNVPASNQIPSSMNSYYPQSTNSNYYMNGSQFEPVPPAGYPNMMSTQNPPFPGPLGSEMKVPVYPPHLQGMQNHNVYPEASGVQVYHPQNPMMHYHPHSMPLIGMNPVTNSSSVSSNSLELGSMNKSHNFSTDSNGKPFNPYPGTLLPQMNNMSGSGYYGQQAYIPPSYIAPASTSAENAEVFPLANPTTNKSNKKKRPLKISVAASTNKEPISSAKSLNSAKPKLEKRPRVSQSRIEPKAIPKSDEYSLVQPEQVSGKAGNVNIKPVKPLLVKPSTSAKEPSIPATPISVKKPIAAKKNNKSGKIIASKPGVLSPAIIPTTETEKKLNENNQINNHDKVLEKEEPDTCFKDMKIKLVSKSLGIGMGEKNEDQGESAIPDETEVNIKLKSGRSGQESSGLESPQAIYS